MPAFSFLPRREPAVVVVKTRFARAALASLLAVVLAGCSSTPSFPEISPEERQGELRFQQEFTQKALEQALSSVAARDERIARLQETVSQRDEEIAAERAKLDALENSVETVDDERQDMAAELEQTKESLARLQETHDKLKRLARDTLEEASSLKQRLEVLQREKLALEEKSEEKEKSIVRLAREIDDLRAQLVSRSGSVGQAVESGAGDTVAATTSRPAPESGDASSAAEKEDAPPVETLGMADLARRAGTILQGRLGRAVDGNVAWDALDITVVSVAGGLLLMALVAFFYVRSARKTKRQLAQYRAYYGQSSARAAAQKSHRKPVRASSDSAVGAETMVVDQQRDARQGERSGVPDDFSPIFRTSVGQEPQAHPQAPPPPPQLPEEDPERTMVMATGNEVDAPRAPSHQEAGARRIIGALDEEASSSGAGAASQYDPEPRKIADLSTSALDSLDTGEDTSSGGVVDGSQTEMISDVSGLASMPTPGTPGAAPSPPSQPSRGADDENELLDELKSIINRKFDDGR